MVRKIVGITLLLAFLVWRAGNSVYVCVTETQMVADWKAGATQSVTERIGRGLLLFPDKPETPIPDRVHYQRYQLLDEHLPPRSKVYFLHEYQGPMAMWEIFSFFRLSALIYPRDTQMVNSPPPPLRRGQVHSWTRSSYVVDLRQKKYPLGDGFTQIATTEDAVLWRQEVQAP